jgi:ketosteroid isomerase-like protein
MSSRALENETLSVVKAFGEAFGRSDIDAVMQRMTQDCVFENTVPAPDGRRYAGQAEVRAAFLEFFAQYPGASFEREETIVSEDRVISRWTRSAPYRIRGVDIYRVRDGLVAEKLSYSKRPA